MQAIAKCSVDAQGNINPVCGWLCTPVYMEYVLTAVLLKYLIANTHISGYKYCMYVQDAHMYAGITNKTALFTYESYKIHAQYICKYTYVHTESSIYVQIKSIPTYTQTHKHVEMY